ncbi:MAG: hypothetical protein IPK12_19375 [Gemmatimonadetes bacterium]|nr:hypothetical protein [Gemmatimonadota bacterium]
MLLRLAGDVFNQVPAEAVHVAIPAVELGYGESLAPATPSAAWPGWWR